jgi:hypothetical protein
MEVEYTLSLYTFQTYQTVCAVLLASALRCNESHITLLMPLILNSDSIN